MAMGQVIVFTLVEVIIFPTMGGFFIDKLVQFSTGDAAGPFLRHVIEATVAGNVIVHYLIGILFMIHVSSCVALVKEIVNPWVLAFIR